MTIDDPNVPNDPTPNAANEVDDPAAARAAFLKAPPLVGAAAGPDPVEPVLDDEAELLDAATRPPAAGDAGSEAGSAPTGTAPGTPDPFAEFGGRDTVANAVELDRALRTEQGVRLVIRQGLEALGYSDAQIRAALGGGPQAEPITGTPPANEPVDPYADILDDDVVTGADVKRLLAQSIEQATQAAVAQAQAQLDPVRAQFEAERNREIAARNDATLIELLGPVPEDPASREAYQNQARDLLNTASRFVDPNNFDPAHVRNGIIQAHAAIEAQAEARYQALLARKREARKNQPAHIGGSTATEGEAKEPQNLAEARAAAKASGFYG